MVSPDVLADIQAWQQVLHRELVAHLADIRRDPGVCGFALELPSDFTNDGVVSRIARFASGFLGKKVPPLDDWEYVPEAATLGASCDGLEELYRKYNVPLEDEAFYQSFGDHLYRACLGVMEQCVTDSAFGGIKVRLLRLSDDEHPIIDQAIETLNDASMRKTARKIAH